MIQVVHSGNQNCIVIDIPRFHINSLNNPNSTDIVDVWEMLHEYKAFISMLEIVMWQEISQIVRLLKPSPNQYQKTVNKGKFSYINGNFMYIYI